MLNYLSLAALDLAIAELSLMVEDEATCIQKRL